MPFSYKQKKFVNDEKVEKFDEWFSKRVPSFYHSVFLGVNLATGTQLKFKYYLNNWFNKWYTAGDRTQPYALIDAHVFYVALSFQFLRGTHLTYK